MNFLVESLAFLLQNDSVCVAVKFLVRQLGRILCVDFPKGRLDGGPRVLEIDLVTVQTLRTRRYQC